MPTASIAGANSQATGAETARLAAALGPRPPLAARQMAAAGSAGVAVEEQDMAAGQAAPRPAGAAAAVTAAVAEAAAAAAAQETAGRKSPRSGLPHQMHRRGSRFVANIEFAPTNPVYGLLETIISTELKL